MDCMLTTLPCIWEAKVSTTYKALHICKMHICTYDGMACRHPVSASSVRCTHLPHDGQQHVGSRLCLAADGGIAAKHDMEQLGEQRQR